MLRSAVPIALDPDYSHGGPRARITQARQTSGKPNTDPVVGLAPMKGWFEGRDGARGSEEWSRRFPIDKPMRSSQGRGILTYGRFLPPDGCLKSRPVLVGS